MAALARTRHARTPQALSAVTRSRAELHAAGRARPAGPQACVWKVCNVPKAMATALPVVAVSLAMGTVMAPRLLAGRVMGLILPLAGWD